MCLFIKAESERAAQVCHLLVRSRKAHTAGAGPGQNLEPTTKATAPVAWGAVPDLLLPEYDQWAIKKQKSVATHTASSPRPQTPKLPSLLAKMSYRAQSQMLAPIWLSHCNMPGDPASAISNTAPVPFTLCCEFVPREL